MSVFHWCILMRVFVLYHIMFAVISIWTTCCLCCWLKYRRNCAWWNLQHCFLWNASTFFFVFTLSLLMEGLCCWDAGITAMMLPDGRHVSSLFLEYHSLSQFTEVIFPALWDYFTMGCTIFVQLINTSICLVTLHRSYPKSVVDKVYIYIRPRRRSQESGPSIPPLSPYAEYTLHKVTDHLTSLSISRDQTSLFNYVFPSCTSDALTTMYRTAFSS